MAEPFDVNTDDAGATTFAPTFQPPDTPSPADVGILPDVSKAMGPVPQLPLPPPPPPPPSPTQDPRQQLLALVTLGLAAGMGPRGGGAGAFHGFMQGQQVLQQDQMRRYQMAVQENQKQQALVAQEQARVETDYRLRQQNLQKSLLAFNKDIEAHPDDEDYYRAQVDRYSAMLRNAGYRTMTPQWFYENMRFVPSDEMTRIQKGLTNYFNSPLVKELVKSNPDQAYKGTIAYKVAGQTEPGHMTVAEAMRRTGVEPALGADGNIAAAPMGKGSEYSDSVARATAEYAGRFGHPPKPDDPTANTWIAQRAEELRPRPEKAPPTPHFSAQDRYDENGKPQSGILNTLTGEWKPTPGQGTVHAAPGAAQAANEKRTTDKALGILDQLDSAIDSAKDLVGPGRGRVSNVEQMVGFPDEKIQKLGVKIKAAKMAVDHAITGSVRAGASPVLLQQWDNILGNKVTASDLKAAVQAMREILGGSAPTPGRFTIEVKQEKQ